MFTKKQRNGIFLLVILIVLLQCAYFFVGIPSKNIVVNQKMLECFNKEIDSLRKIELVSRKPKLFPFNPNFITDFKGADLGMSNTEIDRLLAYRKQGKWINSAKEFKQITKVSDSLLNVIAPYFKFPDWVSNTSAKPNHKVPIKDTYKTYNQKLDLNKVTAKQLQGISGVGEVLSNRIIRFRNKFVGGFISDIQLQDVYGLTPEVIKQITNNITVKTPRPVTRLNINIATVEQLVKIQHIDYDLAANIVEKRILKERFKSITELSKVKGFPADKIEIIELYLSFE